MPWPVDDLSTAGVDSGADRPPRAEFFKLFQRVKTVIAGRGTTDGVASLDDRRRVPDVELGRAVAGGVAALDASGRVPAAQLPPPPALPDAVPVGTIIMYGGVVRPTGWLTCYGGAVSRTTYAELFALIGTRYGAGDGSTTFNLPNFAARVPLGPGSGRAVGDEGGEATHTLTVAEIPAHGHVLGGYRTDGAGQPRNKLTGEGGNSDSVDAGHSHGVRETGGGRAHNNMPPYAVISFYIKA